MSTKIVIVNERSPFYNQVGVIETAKREAVRVRMNSAPDSVIMFYHDEYRILMNKNSSGNSFSNWPDTPNVAYSLYQQGSMQ